MHTFTKIKKSISLITLLLIIFVSLSPITNAAITINDDDGIWSEDFIYQDLGQAEENLIIQNSSIDLTSGVISLPHDTRPRVYNFAEKDFPHKASIHRSINLGTGFFSSFFNTPDNPRFSEFNAREYNAIKEKDNNLLVTRQSVGFIFRQVIQEYRFQLDVGPESIGEIKIYWKGAAENIQDLKIYYWRFGPYQLASKWIQLDSTQNATGTIIFNETIDEDNAELAIMENNYFYVRVVATAPFILRTCSLSVDYIEVISKSEKAYEPGPGYITTKNPISPPQKDFYWEMLTWSDYQPDKTQIRYQVMYDPKDDGKIVPIPDNYFSGSNTKGFTQSPIYLNNIPTSGPDAITELYIRSNLTSETSSQTPKLYNWAVTWQTNTKEWSDSFNSSYRIESKTMINVDDGSINISSLQGEWPMMGYNPQNTRATDSKGPQNKNPPLQWYTSMDDAVGGGFNNPVIGDGFLYIFNHSGYLLRYDIQGLNVDKPDSIDLVAREYYNSPLLTEEFIIVASGHSKDGGSELNYIFGVSKDFTNIWKFKYEEKISYYASPVVYDNKLFITSWTGDTKLFSDLDTNKVIALDLNKVPTSGEFTTTHDAFLWEYTLPAGSYSTPAVYNDMVFVACKSKMSQHDTFFVLDAEGNGDKTTNLLWSADVGSVERSSPVIYDNTVFITSKKQSGLFVTALDINPESTERILWENQICFALPFAANADSTPAVYNEVLYVASLRGNIYALNTKTGAIIWQKEVYSTLRKNLVTSSPAYADGHIYIGTPSGKTIALNTRDNGSIAWERRTFENEYFARSPIYSSPIISNGMLFISDEDGTLYAYGAYEELNREMTGAFTSISINLPTGAWWGQFHANYTKPDGSTIRFSILDNNKENLRDVSTGDNLNLGELPGLRTIYLKAELSADNLSVNPSINSWKITFKVDNHPPNIVKRSFKPNPDGWLNTTTPKFSIEVWDNQTGLYLEKSEYTLKYDTENNKNLTYKNVPAYTGSNGVNFSVLSVDISTLPFAENTTRLREITFKVKDFGNNTASQKFELKQDILKPISIISDETNGSQFNTEYVIINATAQDPGDKTSASGVDLVELYYRYSLTPTFSGNWIYYDESKNPEPTREFKPSWEFINKKGGGYYELCTIAYDVVGNVEEFPDKGDTNFIMDNKSPSKPVYPEENWFKERPSISIEFSDDFLLHTIKYQPNFDTSEWITIASNISKRTYNEPWQLKEEFWQMMDNEKQYVLMFWINDTLGNERIITQDQGYIIYKDQNKPYVDVTLPYMDTRWSLDDTLIISAFAHDGDGSGVESVELFYRYSENGTFIGAWISYGILTSEPFEWEFEAIEGDGYYEFKIVVEDAAGNVAESDIISTGVNLFPTALVATMIVLIIALGVLSLFIIIKWRKK
ncbi:MAG: PQQ-binding-like beta-propeller repeat protein [Thermoplasmatota archaeon]